MQLVPLLLGHLALTLALTLAAPPKELDKPSNDIVTIIWWLYGGSDCVSAHLDMNQSTTGTMFLNETTTWCQPVTDIQSVEYHFWGSGNPTFCMISLFSGSNCRGERWDIRPACTNQPFASLRVQCEAV